MLAKAKALFSAHPFYVAAGFLGFFVVLALVGHFA